MSYAEDSSIKAEDRAKAKGVLNKLMQYKLVWYLYFLRDLLNEMAKLSLLFQRDNISISSAVTKLQSSQMTLRYLLENTGEHSLQFEQDLTNDNEYKEHELKNVVNSATLNRQKSQIVQSLLDCLDARFENIHTDPLYLACNIFYHKNWPDFNDNALVIYGNREIKPLYEHFQEPLLSVDCDREKALSEWNELKQHVARYRPVHPLAVWQRISQEDSGKMTLKTSCSSFI